MEHKLDQVAGETQFCGDHYCDGHVKWTIECAVCGPLDLGYGRHTGRDQMKIYELEHRLSILEG